MAVQIINGIMAVFFVIGALDYLLDNKLGLGSEFERGFGCAEKLFITMGGFVALAPVIARVLSPVVCPFFRRLGADPSLFAGIFSGVDAGGYPLALQLADDPAMGVFNGAIVGSMLGVALLCTIPLGIASTKPEERVSMIYGLICGLITIPIGCLVGGFVGGYGMTGVLKNTLPVLVLAIIGSAPAVRQAAVRLERSRPRWFYVAEIVLFTAGLLLCVAGMVGSTYTSFLYAQF